MEINISKFFAEAAPMDYSASVAEIGSNAGSQTWGAAVADANDWLLLDTDEKREAFKLHIADFGAWSDEEVDAWSDTELQALFIQMVSGDMREAGLDADSGSAVWAQYEKDAESGRVTGCIFRGDDGAVYYQLNY